MKSSNRTPALIEILEWPGVVETARRLGISINRTYHLVWSGKLPAQQIAGQWRISPEAINSRLAMKAAQAAQR
jgi:hypothetical protein